MAKRSRADASPKTPSKKYKASREAVVSGATVGVVSANRSSARSASKYSGELKSYNAVVSAAACSDTFNLVPTDGQLYGIVQGITASTRIGRKIMLRKIQVRGFYTNTNADPGGGVFRFDVFLDRQANGAIPSGLTVYDNTDLTPGNDFLNLDNSHRYKRLASLTKYITSDEARVANTHVPFECNIDCDIPVMYDTTAGTIADITSANILFVPACSVTTTANQAVSYAWRFRYTDA